MDFKQFAQLIMIEQTTFALPFAYLGILFAGGGTPWHWLWCTVALAAARTAGMCFNRVLDADIDAKNPRTAGRLVPSGEVSPRVVWAVAVASSLLLILSSYMLNDLVFYLSFLAVVLLYSYSLFKRFSSTSHLYLGFVEAAAPVGGFLSVTGKLDPLALVPGAAIMFWIAGLDILYALQDIDFDRRHGLHSVPARWGKKKALLFSRICYALSVGCMCVAGYFGGMTGFYWLSVLGATMIFIRQQWLALNEKDAIQERMAAVFALNRFVSPVIFLGAMLDLLVRISF